MYTGNGRINLSSVNKALLLLLVAVCLCARMFSKLENRLGSFRRSTSNLQRDASNASIASTNYEPSPAPSPVSKRNRAKRREEMLTKLPAEYLQDQFDPVLYELQQLPSSFDEQMLDAIVDSRASVLEVRIGPVQAPLTCGWCASKNGKPTRRS